MRNIFTKLLYEIEKHHDCILVTIVEKSGSAPRGLGSQMLVNHKGLVTGSIGGGTVEYKAEELAKKTLSCEDSSKKSFIHTFDLYNSNNKNDIGMVCGGTVSLHFQYIDSDSQYFVDLAKNIISQTNTNSSNFLNLSTDQLPIISKEPYSKSESCDRFSVPIPTNNRVIIFGGGHICLALLPLLNSINFTVTIMDNRKEYANTDRFPTAEKVICGDYLNVSKYINFSPDDYVIIMTNGHSHDLTLQKQVLKHNLAYVGVIGSKSKIEHVNAKLLEAGISSQNIKSVHTPIGIDIGAITPEEIAISIAGELILCRHQRTSA